MERRINGAEHRKRGGQRKEQGLDLVGPEPFTNLIVNLN
jgi:hypothetical protein